MRVLFLVLLISSNAVSQDLVQLYLHTDKSIYQPGETIWFTGYILNRDERIMQRQHVLYTVLVDTAHKNAASRKRFLTTYGLTRGGHTDPR